MDYQLWKEWERENREMQYVRIIYMYEHLGFFFFFRASAKFKWILFKYYSILHVLRVLKCNLLNLFFLKKNIWRQVDKVNYNIFAWFFVSLLFGGIAIEEQILTVKWVVKIGYI